MIKDAINDYGSKVGKVFADRSKTVGASEIGLCARRIAWTKRGTPTDAQEALSGKKRGRSDPKTPRSKAGSLQLSSNWGAHVRGTVIEEQLWVPAMRARFGAELVMAGKDQKTLTLGTLSATPDGVLINGSAQDMLRRHGIKVDHKRDKAVVVECKTIDPRVNLTEEKEENAFQVQVQMGTIRELTPYKPTWAIISYIDASFWHEVAEFAVPYRPEDFEAAKMRSAQILNADPSDLKPEGWISGAKECGWCPWEKRCSKMRGAVPLGEMNSAAQDPQFAAEIIDLCKQANELNLKVKADTEAYKDLQNTIKERLKDKGVRKIPGVVNWYGVKGRESWDVAAMAAELKKRGVSDAEIDKFSTAGEPTNALSIDKKVALL